MKRSRWSFGLVAGVVLSLAAVGAWWHWGRDGAQAVQYRTARIERGPLSATVSASGAVNPVTQVSVGTQVSGQIRDLYVDFNSEVKAGQLIAQIDPETFEYRVRQAQADVDAARAAVLTAQANQAAARAAVSRARVELTEAQRDLERRRMLVQREFIARSEADRAEALVNTATEALRSAEAQLGVTEAQVKSAQAIVAQREAALAQARVDLARTRITSPVDGIVIKRAIERGQTVAASLQAPELFVIARNLNDMQVDASIDESDVGRVRSGQRATFTVDAFPGQTFEGTVGQVRKAAQNVANVVTYVAVIAFPNPAGRLLPGMTANVRIVTDQRDSVLKVPNAALRVRIPGVEPAAPGAAEGGAPKAAVPAGSAPPARPPGGTTGWWWQWLPSAQAQPAGGGPGGGGMAALRERLTQELGLSPQQQARLEAISAELRPRFMALRELPEEQRGGERERLMAELRDRINAMLDAGQRARYAQLQAQPRPQPPAAATPGGPAAATAAAAAGPQPAARPDGPAATGGKSDAPAAASGDAARPAPTAPTAPTAPSAGPVAPPLAGQGPLVEMRNRLVAELRLTVPQAERLDALYAEARPRFMALRELPEAERPKARERVQAELRARIGDILTPEQKQRYAALQAEQGGRPPQRGRVHLLGEDGKPVAFNVRLGITDGTMTELLVQPGSPEAARLVEGAAVITAVIGASAPAAPRPAAAGPRLPF